MSLDLVKEKPGKISKKNKDLTNEDIIKYKSTNFICYYCNAIMIICAIKSDKCEYPYLRVKNSHLDPDKYCWRLKKNTKKKNPSEFNKELETKSLKSSFFRLLVKHGAKVGTESVGIDDDEKKKSSYSSLKGDSTGTRSVANIVKLPSNLSKLEKYKKYFFTGEAKINEYEGYYWIELYKDFLFKVRGTKMPENVKIHLESNGSIEKNFLICFVAENDCDSNRYGKKYYYIFDHLFFINEI